MNECFVFEPKRTVQEFFHRQLAVLMYLDILFIFILAKIQVGYFFHFFVNLK